MVHITDQRYDGYGPKGGPIISEQPAAKAALNVLQYQLAYGGRVKEIKSDSVLIHTSVMGDRDEILYAGDVDAIKRVCHYWKLTAGLVAPSEDVSDLPVVMQEIAKLLIAGKPRLRCAVTMMLLSEIADLKPEAVERTNIGDLMSLLELHLEKPLSLSQWSELTA